jgi:uncharacterized protein YpmS
MIDHLQIPILGAFAGTAGLVAQVAIPGDLQNWPVTAMLVLVILTCLGIIVWLSRASFAIAKASSDALVEAAKALTKVTEKMSTTEGQNNKIIESVAEMVVELKARPCIHR